MPQSLSNIYIHLVFSTKNREAMLVDSIRPNLHNYMATVLSEMQCPAILINSVADHVHILLKLARTVRIATVAEQVKKGSSKWLKSEFSNLHSFSWQAGYGAFSVSESNAASVAHYIQEQEEHHRHKTFQEEYREFLTKNKIKFDERYVWD